MLCSIIYIRIYHSTLFFISIDYFYIQYIIKNELIYEARSSHSYRHLHHPLLPSQERYHLPSLYLSSLPVLQVQPQAAEARKQLHGIAVLHPPERFQPSLA